MFSLNDINFNNSNKYILNENTEQFIDYNKRMYNFLLSFNEQVNKNTISLYKNVYTKKENGIEKIMNEETQLFTITTMLSISNFIKFSKQMLDIFKKDLNGYFRDKGQLISYITNLDTNSNRLFLVNGYKYLEMKTPCILLYDTFIKDLHGFIDKDSDEIYNKIRSRYDGNYVDSIRGNLLGLNKNIQEKDFQKNVFMYFRNNSMDKSDIPYRINDIDDIIYRYSNYNTYIDNIDNYINSIEEELQKILIIIEALNDNKLNSTKDLILYLNGVKYRDTDKQYDERFHRNFNMALKLKTSTICNMINCYGIILSEKISAIKLAVLQYELLFNSIINETMGV